MRIMGIMNEPNATNANEPMDPIEPVTPQQQLPPPSSASGYQLPPPPPPYYPPVMQPQTNAWAIISLVSSVLAWVGFFGIGGLIGVIAGAYARNEIKKSNGAQTGDGLALTGIILGAINMILVCLGLVCFAVFVFSIPFAAMVSQ
jgi:Domain of unknown function (DUF4190)